jgi:hypothetical protein
LTDRHRNPRTGSRATSGKPQSNRGRIIVAPLGALTTTLTIIRASTLAF